MRCLTLSQRKAGANLITQKLTVVEIQLGQMLQGSSSFDQPLVDLVQLVDEFRKLC